MKVQTSTLSPNQSPHDRHLTYCGLDCCLTLEIFEVLEKQLREKNEPWNALIYDFEKAMQGPALELMERGWLIDEEQRREASKFLNARKVKLQELLNDFARVLWDKPLNANSPAQLKAFFYDTMALPEQHSITQGQRKVSTNREALEKLSQYFYARPLINVILAIRETVKKLSVLETEISSDGRMRTSYNVAGTETGRWSSSSSADGSGTNLQNITPELRRMFVADLGWKLCYLDLEQAESRVVGLLIWRTCGDTTYLDACDSGDLHTTVSRLVWPHLGWTGDHKANKELAESPFYRHFSYRDMAKRGGHGTNYFGTPRTMARHLKVDEKVMKDFQSAYFKAFPIRLWHDWVRMELIKNQSLTTILGRKRTLLGRSGDDSTLREAIAYEPQSTVGDLLNLALWRIWKFEPRVQILGQIHDAVVFQYPDNPSIENDILSSCLNLTKIPLTSNGKTIIIPADLKTGFNWSYKTPDNPRGLSKWQAAG